MQRKECVWLLIILYTDTSYKYTVNNLVDKIAQHKGKTYQPGNYTTYAFKGIVAKI